MIQIDQLEIAETVIKSISGCVYCASCAELAKEYFSSKDYIDQLFKEQSSEQSSDNKTTLK